MKILYSEILLFFLIITLWSIETKIVSDNVIFFNASLSEIADVFKLTENQTGKIFSATAMNKENLNQAMLQERKTAENYYPRRDWSTEDFDTSASSVLVYDLNKEKVLFEKKITQNFPIASLTKLMTTVIVSEYKDYFEDWLCFKKEDLSVEGHGNIFQENEEYRVEDLLAASLISSSNEAISLLTRSLEPALIKQGKAKSFVELMNLRAAEIGLSNTHFSNPIGFDGDNFSDTWDLLKITRALLEDNNKIFESSVLKIKTIFSRAGREVNLYNTNKLLEKISNDILISKTGHTDLAQGCMLIVKNFSQDQVVLIILGSSNRAAEMEKLINWVNKAYVFE
ncbi:D-alanyl-D-alanine carboxypeptidase [bacterium]|nr:MAG: D-alanyl-D-alanine carboxypeptidase [bacterium]